MKKLMIMLLMVFALGCSKKFAAAPQEQVKPEETAGLAGTEHQEAQNGLAGDIGASKDSGLNEAGIDESVSSLKGEGIYDFKDVLFDFDKYNIRHDDRPVLDSAAAYLKKNENMNIVIEGHCDERGTNEYNLALGERRANAAKSYLSSQGIAINRMSAVTYGEEKPVCTEQNESCRQKNRRAHFTEAK